jgi:hypothetical protein
MSHTNSSHGGKTFMYKKFWNFCWRAGGPILKKDFSPYFQKWYYTLWLKFMQFYFECLYLLGWTFWFQIWNKNMKINKSFWLLCMHLTAQTEVTYSKVPNECHFLAPPKKETNVFTVEDLGDQFLFKGKTKKCSF